MKAKQYSIHLILFLLIPLSGCSKWLDVTPRSEIRRPQHYSTAKGFQQTLTGVYMSLADDQLYGKTLTWHAPEIMAHQYVEVNGTKDKELYNHEYKNNNLVNLIDGIWAKMYNTIVNINDALLATEEYGHLLHPNELGIIRGELLALRAWLHFDLLRLYGYGNYANRTAELADKPTLPYVRTLNKNITPQSTTQEYYQLLTKDLEEATELLKANDPIANPDMDKKILEEINVEGYYNKRNEHLNYYAARALEARVHLWFGTPEALEKAHTSAKEVVDASEDKTLNKNKNINTNIHLLKNSEYNDATRSFSTEALFALEKKDLDTSTALYFKVEHTASDSYAIAISGNRAKHLFEASSSDLRFKGLRENPRTKNYTPLRYITPESAKQYTSRVNMIRLPEVYYILAETYLSKDNTTEAKKLLDNIRTLRGSGHTSNNNKEELTKELRLEYEREFIAEGVLFFMQKRLGLENPFTDGTDGTTSTTTGKKMTDAEYLLPFPTIEIQNGRIQ